MRAIVWPALALLVACAPKITSTGGEIRRDAGLDAGDDVKPDAGVDAAVDSGLCEGCVPCDGGTSRDGVFCCTGCWDTDLCALISNELTCGEHGSVCAQCINGLVCDAGLCGKP